MSYQNYFSAKQFYMILALISGLQMSTAAIYCLDDSFTFIWFVLLGLAWYEIIIPYSSAPSRIIVNLGIPQIHSNVDKTIVTVSAFLRNSSSVSYYYDVSLLYSNFCNSYGLRPERNNR